MVYSNTVKFIILGILLIVIAFALGMVWNVNRSNASQRHLQECTDYQQAMVVGNAGANPGCNSK